MSTKHKREEAFGGNFEKYSTPVWCVRRLDEALKLPRGRWLESAAGDGYLVRAFGSFYDWTMVEIGDVSKLDMLGKVHNEDFLTWAPPRPRFDVAVTNPPNSLAVPFFRKMREIANHVLMFLPWPWYGGSERAELFESDPPRDIFLLPDRVQFIDPTVDHACPKCAGSGNIDTMPFNGLPGVIKCKRCDGKGAVRASSPSVDYAWFLWDSVRIKPTPATRVHRLRPTPLEERQWWREPLST